MLKIDTYSFNLDTGRCSDQFNGTQVPDGWHLCQFETTKPPQVLFPLRTIHDKPETYPEIGCLTILGIPPTHAAWYIVLNRSFTDEWSYLVIARCPFLLVWPEEGPRGIICHAISYKIAGNGTERHFPHSIDIRKVKGPKQTYWVRLKDLLDKLARTVESLPWALIAVAIEDKDHPISTVFYGQYISLGPKPKTVRTVAVPGIPCPDSFPSLLDFEFDDIWIHKSIADELAFLDLYLKA